MMKKEYVTDNHVHIVSEKEIDQIEAENQPYTKPNANPLVHYFENHSKLKLTPLVICNIYLSYLQNSNNIFKSLEEFEKLKQSEPDKYRITTMLGFIEANPQYATEELLNTENIKGIRLVLHDTKPGNIHADNYTTDEWSALYQRLIARNQHFLIYATNPETVLKILECLPKELTVGIDHLGNCESSAEDPHYINLLNEAKERGNVYFKGPGYRTDLNPNKVLPYLLKITEIVGYDKLLLDATDAPHVGNDPSGIPYSDSYPELKDIIGYVKRLEQRLANETNIDPLYFQIVNSCQTYQVALPDDIIAYPFDEQPQIMRREKTTFNIDKQSMESNFYSSRNADKNKPIIVTNSGFTGLEHIHPQRFARGLTPQGYTCFSFDYRGFGANESLSELGRVRLSQQIKEIEASVRYLKENYPNRKIILNGWGMAGGLSFKAAANLAKEGVIVDGVIGINGLYNSKEVQRQVRGEAGFDEFSKWLENEIQTREKSGDPVNIDPFDVYPLAPKTREYVDHVLRKAPGYNDITAVDIEFAKELFNFEVTLEDFQILNDHSIPTHMYHGENNDIHPIAHVETAHQMDSENSFTALPDHNHTDFMNDKDERFIDLTRHLNEWIKEEVINKHSINRSVENSQQELDHKNPIEFKI